MAERAIVGGRTGAGFALRQPAMPWGILLSIKELLALDGKALEAKNT
ncbi:MULTISPECIES: hypothetical protein [unclassified Acidovorax]|jgi:hypothetical protein|nr:hypothetical protein [Acidovorax sp. NO-1]